MNTDALREKILVYGAQVVHQPAPMPCFQQTHATDDGYPIRLSKPSCGAFVNDDQIGTELFGQQHRGKFARAQRMLETERGNFSDWSSGMDFDPWSIRHESGSGFASATQDDLDMNFRRDVNVIEKLPEQIKLSDPREGDKRGRIGNNDHSLRRAAVARSSARSSAV